MAAAGWDGRPASSPGGKRPPDFQRASRPRRKGLWRAPGFPPPPRAPPAVAPRPSPVPILLQGVPPPPRGGGENPPGPVEKGHGAGGFLPPPPPVKHPHG